MNGVARRGWSWLAVIALNAVMATFARADSVRWAGWSADESKCAYFVRQPVGETGFTDITLYIRDTAKGKPLDKQKIRDGRKAMDSGAEETSATLEAVEETALADLKKQGFVPGKPVPFTMSPAKFTVPSPDDPTVVTSATLTWEGKSYIFRAEPSKNWSFLRARVVNSAKPDIAVDQQRIWPLVRMEGTPDEQVYRPAANFPTSFNLSPKGQWMASGWEGRMNLPDSLSWPAYAFTFRTSHLPQK